MNTHQSSQPPGDPAAVPSRIGLSVIERDLALSALAQRVEPLLVSAHAMHGADTFAPSDARRLTKLAERVVLRVSQTRENAALSRARLAVADMLQDAALVAYRKTETHSAAYTISGALADMRDALTAMDLAAVILAAFDEGLSYPYDQAIRVCPRCFDQLVTATERALSICEPCRLEGDLAQPSIDELCEAMADRRQA